MGDLDAGDGGEGRGEDLGFVFMGGDGFGHHLDVHPGEGGSGVDEPLHLGFLIRAGQGREIADFRIEEGFRRLHVGPGRGRAEREERKRHRGCRLSESH